MKSLKPHICNFDDAFSAVVRKKQRPRRSILEQIAPDVASRYSNYDAMKTNLHTVQPSAYSDPERAALIHCYEAETAPLSKLKSEIKSLQENDLGNLCQYCGVDSSLTFDHFLPKELFPEFAVLPINLIPCCAGCNQKKGSKWSNGSRTLFINLYFDQITPERILFCSITYSQTNIPIVTFFVRKHPNMTSNTFEKIESHYIELDLSTKFKESSNAVISETKNGLKLLEDKSRNTILRRLDDQIRTFQITYGINYWKLALLEALKQNNDFLASCVEV